MSIVPTFYQVIMPQGMAFCTKSCKRLQSSEPCSSLHLWVKGSIALGEGPSLKGISKAGKLDQFWI